MTIPNDYWDCFCHPGFIEWEPEESVIRLQGNAVHGNPASELVSITISRHCPLHTMAGLMMEKGVPFDLVKDGASVILTQKG